MLFRSISGEQRVLETLAAVQIGEPAQTEMFSSPVVFLTSQTQQLETLPPGNRWLLWTQARFTPTSKSSGIVIDSHQPLQQQLNSANFTTEKDIARYSRSPLTQNSQLN